MIVALDKALHSQKIPYVVIGGIAASLHGRPRMTMDSDIVIVLEKIKVPEFIQTMKQRGFSVTLSSEPKMIARLQRGQPIKLRFGKHFSVDVRIASFSLDTKAITRAKFFSIFNVKLPIVSPEDLIVYKIARFDAIDQLDIQMILAKHSSKLDSRYMISTATVLGEETGKKEILENLSTVFRWMKKGTS